VPPRIRVRQGDITTFEGDAIVNPANEQLRLDVGVAGAIRQAGGPSIQQACDRNGPVPTGDAVITAAGKLGVRHVIHAAIMGEEPTSLETIRRATAAAIRLAVEHGDTRVAMPVLGSGLGRWSVREAAEAMLDIIRTSREADELDVIVLFGYRADDADELEQIVEHS
jgi:O-acetyl-ADP-ribose deacetylase (regulator of RNase III)